MKDDELPDCYEDYIIDLIVRKNYNAVQELRFPQPGTRIYAVKEFAYEANIMAAKQMAAQMPHIIYKEGLRFIDMTPQKALQLRIDSIFDPLNDEGGIGERVLELVPGYGFDYEEEKKKERAAEEEIENAKEQTRDQQKEEERQRILQQLRNVQSRNRDRGLGY